MTQFSEEFLIYVQTVFQKLGHMTLTVDLLLSSARFDLEPARAVKFFSTLSGIFNAFQLCWAMNNISFGTAKKPLRSARDPMTENIEKMSAQRKYVLE